MSSNTISHQSTSLDSQLKQAMDAMDFAKCQEIQAKITALAAVDAEEIATKTKLITKAVDDTVLALSILKQTKGAIQAFHAEAETLEVEAETLEVEAETLEVEAETPEVEADTPEVEAETPEVEADTPEVEADTPEVEAVEYSKMKRADLKKLCKERKIKGFSKLKKAELIEKLKNYVSKPINEAPKPKKAKKAKKAKAVVTAENRCRARKWSAKLDGNNQCKKMSKSGCAFCSTCQKMSENYGGRVGPDLWKFCYEQSPKITRGDTKKKGKAGMWFGSIDQYEDGFAEDCVPATSVLVGDIRMIVTCYKNHEKHATVSAVQQTANAVLCVDLFENKTMDWPKKWHLIGVAEKASDQADKKAARKVKQTVNPGFDSEDDDEADVAESSSDGELPESEIVIIHKNDCDYRLNRKTLEVVGPDYDDVVGSWQLVLDDGAVAPDSPTRDWLAANGIPDEDAEEAYLPVEEED
jgi:hypothetical protein